jgi:MFS family permease
MYRTLVTISSLLLSIAILLTGNGLLTTLLTLRAAVEGYPALAIGTIMAMYFIGFMAGTFLCPEIIARVGHIRAFATMAAVASCLIIIQGLWVNPWIWGLARFLCGICLVGIYMVTESWLNQMSGNQNRGRVLATYTLVMLIALGLGQFLILADDVVNLTLFTIAAGLFSLGLVPVALTRIPEPAPIAPIRPGLGNLFRISSLGFSGSLAAGLMCGAFWSLAPLFAEENGMSQAGIAVFMSATILGGALLQYPIGHWSDRTDRRLILVCLGFCSALVALLSLFIPSSAPSLLALCMFLFGGMMFSIYPVSVAHVNDHPEAKDLVATSSSLLLVNGIGAAAGPLLGGALIQYLGNASLLGLFLAIGICLGSCALYWRHYGRVITAEEKTAFVPITRTTHVAMEGIATDRL